MSTQSYPSISVRILLILMLLAGVFAAAPVHAVAAIRYVKWDASGSNNGTSWANAYVSLQSALSAAAFGDEIWVAAGTYKPTTGVNRTHTFTLKNGVAIYGGFAGNESSRAERNPAVNVTILSGDIGTLGFLDDNVYHVLTGTSGSAILDGFTITAGNANSTGPNSLGGGLYKTGAGNLNLRNIILSGNSASDSGGGIFVGSGNLILNSVILDGNSADLGGGLYVVGNSNLTNVAFSNNAAASAGGGFNTNGNAKLTNVTFNANSSGYGGGILFEAGSLTVSHGTFTDNTTTNDGGAINSAGLLTISNSTFSGNEAYLGAGILVAEGTVTVTHSTFTHNSTSGLAGGPGIMNGAGTVTVSDSIFSDNVADGAGGSLFNADPATMTVRNSSFTNNAGYNGGAIYNGGSLNVVNSNFSDNHITEGSGGAIANFAGSLTITRSWFSNNNAVTNPYFVGDRGEGGAVYTLSALTIINSTFDGNQASRGGALSCTATATITSTDSTYVSNSALSEFGGDGGAIYANCRSTFVRNTFASNTAAHYGGAMLTHDDNGLTKITNSSFYDNEALAGSGGGIANYGGLSIQNSTFSNNNGSSGGAIRNGLGGTLSLRNSILANSVGGMDCIKSDSTPAIENINNLIETTGAGLESCGDSLLTSDPVLGALQENGGLTKTMALLPGSPAIDAGEDASCLATDQRGVTRPQGPHCDIGAYEYSASTPMLKLNSVAAHDGWVMETSETSNQGGSVNAAAATFHLGDSAAKQQSRAILSFNTSILPDNAVITRVTLKIKKQSVIGTNPFTTHGKIAIDIRKGAFSNANPLQPTDFQAAANKPGVGLFVNNPQPGSWYGARLNTASYPYINLKGITQVRLRFQIDDDNDAIADLIRFYSGNAPVASRPVLVIEYYVP